MFTWNPESLIINLIISLLEQIIKCYPQSIEVKSHVLAFYKKVNKIIAIPYAHLAWWASCRMGINMITPYFAYVCGWLKHEQSE